MENFRLILIPCLHRFNLIPDFYNTVVMTKMFRLKEMNQLLIRLKNCLFPGYEVVS